MKLFWIFFVLLLICPACGGTSDPVPDPGVRYSRTETDGKRIELVLMWDKQRAVVGSGTIKDFKTSLKEPITLSDIAEIRNHFTPEKLTIYQQDSFTGTTDSGVVESWVTLEQGRQGPSKLFIFHGEPSRTETVQMLEKLDRFTRTLLTNSP